MPHDYPPVYLSVVNRKNLMDWVGGEKSTEIVQDLYQATLFSVKKAQEYINTNLNSGHSFKMYAKSDVEDSPRVILNPPSLPVTL